MAHARKIYKIILFQAHHADKTLALIKEERESRISTYKRA
jgi:hypothetical protein